MKESLANAQLREREARQHGRRTKLEQELNALGLSLLAPPLSDFREVRGNEWEGWSVPETVFTGKLQRVINELMSYVDENIEGLGANQAELLAIKIKEVLTRKY